MASAVKIEIEAFFLNDQLSIPLHIALTNMDHPQPTTKIKTDNNTTYGFVNGTIKQNKKKQWT